MNESDIYTATTENRLRFAATVEALPQDRHTEPTLCAGWDVRVLTAHMLQPMTVGFGRFVVAALRARGNTDAAIDSIARREAKRPMPELIADLRRLADRRVSPRRVGPMGPFAESCIHLRDLARPLGLDADVPVEHWFALLAYLDSADAAPSLVRGGLLDGIAMRPTDGPWPQSTGALIEGPSEALAMAITGRQAALADLTGPGVDILRTRQDDGDTRR